MKKQIIRIFAVLLTAILVFGLMPTVSFAGGGDPISDGYVFAAYPMAGEHPTKAPVPSDFSDSEMFTVKDYSYLNDAGFGRAVFDEECFENGETYRLQITLKAKGDYNFEKDSVLYINDRKASNDVITYDEAVISVDLTCVSETNTVTFDANGYGTAPDPIQVPNGATIWDAIQNFNAVRIPDQPYMCFWDWDDDPFSVDNIFSFKNTITEPITLYAIWQRGLKSVELYVTLPDRCMTEYTTGPIVRAERNARYSVYGDEFYYGQDVIGIADGIYGDALQKGQTYYSRATVSGRLGANIPSVKLHGAKLLGTRRLSDWSFDVLFSVTIPSGNTITDCSFYLETPRAGTSAEGWPESGSLTPGLIAEADQWYPTSGVGVSAPCEGVFEAGKTYYTRMDFRPAGSYNIDYKTLKPKAVGLNVKIEQMLDLASWYAIPNFVGACVSVKIPQIYNFTAEVPYGGGKIRYDRAPSDYWVTIMDFREEEGPITLEAKADPEHMFKSWYDAKSYDMLSKNAVYTFNLDHDVYIKANFVKKTPFVDVGAWDYFYEPVLWAIEHEPVITGGTDATHFSPKKACTREQIVTFLWKANGEPEPESSENLFVDVKPGKYYYKAVQWAVQKGITGGVGDGKKFGVGQTCTREQAMTFLWKAKGSPNPSSYHNPFSDVKEGKYYYKAVLWAYNRKPQVTGGVGGGKFGVGQTCTRAQIITFLAKVYGPAG